MERADDRKKLMDNFEKKLRLERLRTRGKYR
jgi:hypothetical protein